MNKNPVVAFFTEGFYNGANKIKLEKVENQENTPEVKLTSEEKLHQEMAEIQQQHAELKDKYMRLLADFDNYKKRTIKEKIDFMRTAAEDTMSALLPVLDDFDRALVEISKSNEEELRKGVELINNKLILFPLADTSEFFSISLLFLAINLVISFTSKFDHFN